MNDAAYQSMLMQNHRLRIQLHLERKGISTLNMPLKALQYINDGFKVGRLPGDIAFGLEVLLPIWAKEKGDVIKRVSAAYRAANS